MQFDESIDCLGLYCPMPIIRTAESIRQMQIGQILEIIADDDGIVEDLTDWCKMTGQEFLEIQSKDGEYKGYIKKITNDS